MKKTDFTMMMETYLKDKNPELRDQVILEGCKIVERIINDYYNDYFDKEGLYFAGLKIVIHIIDNFSEERSYKNIRNYITATVLTYFKKYIKWNPNIEYSFMLSGDTSIEDYAAGKATIDQEIAKLNEKQQKIVKMRIEGYTFEEIAKLYCMSKQYICVLYQAAMDQIKMAYLGVTNDYNKTLHLIRGKKYRINRNPNNKFSSEIDWKKESKLCNFLSNYYPLDIAKVLAYIIYYKVSIDEVAIAISINSEELKNLVNEAKKYIETEYFQLPLAK